MVVDCSHLTWECIPGNDLTDSHVCNNCVFAWSCSSDYGRTKQNGLCDVCGHGPTGYVTKDSGKREEFDSGMVRDTQDGKPRYDLLLPHGVPYRHQFLTRVAELLARGAEKYSDRNWERASGREELDRFKSSAFRHFMQWMTDETDEDHAAAVVFNLLAYETVLYKLKAGTNDRKATG